jgi:hypothetical protein
VAPFNLYIFISPLKNHDAGIALPKAIDLTTIPVSQTNDVSQ